MRAWFGHPNLESMIIILIKWFTSEMFEIVLCFSYRADEDDKRTLELNTCHSSSRYAAVDNQELRNETSDYSVVAADNTAVQITQVCGMIL